MSKQLLTGLGWRIGWFPEAEVFQGLVGGEDWAIELTEQEIKDFCALSLQLQATMQNMAAELSDQENLSCSADTDNIEVEVSGFPHSYSLRFQLKTGRRGEGMWSAAIALELLIAVQKLINKMKGGSGN